MEQIIKVIYSGREIGRLGYDNNEKKSSFQYHPDFLKEGNFLHLFPYIFRKTDVVQVFNRYEGETFRGLPPMIADSLPDTFGNIIFKEWIERHHKDEKKISPLEQLTYVSNRGMGALEYRPAKNLPSNIRINLDEMADIARKVLNLKRSVTETSLNEDALYNIFKIGTSAGGVRPKILVSEHKETGQLIPGDIETSEKYFHYLIKLSIDSDRYSREKVEYIYYKMATKAGIDMMPSKLIDDKHFATLRFDRQNGKKKHILTASGLTGWDFKNPEVSSYENLFKLSIDLNLPQKDLQKLFKRMVFNVVFANTDDHLKNFTFIFNDDGDSWNLAPAYDLTFPFDPLLNFTRVNRALSINGKRSDINITDILQVADTYTIKNARRIVKDIIEITDDFPSLCKEQRLPDKVIQSIQDNFIL